MKKIPQSLINAALADAASYRRKQMRAQRVMMPALARIMSEAKTNPNKFANK